MKAKKCDRCGKYYDEYEKDVPGEMQKDNQSNNSTTNHIGLMRYIDGFGSVVSSKPIDLCHECMEKLIRFLRGDADIPDISEAYNVAHTIMLYDANVNLQILESIPKDMRGRVYSIEQNASGDIAVYFDTYFSNEDEKNERQ